MSTPAEPPRTHDAESFVENLDSQPPSHSKASAAQTKPKRKASSSQIQLSRIESFLAFVVFTIWLILFAVGILVQTEPYRCEIDSGGVGKLKGEGATRNGAQPTPTSNEVGQQQPAQARAEQLQPSPTSAPRTVSNNGQTNPCTQYENNKKHSKLTAWAVVLFCFLPLNLAWVCAAAGALGAFGSRANLSDDQTHRASRDNTNPYTSAVLRGFFVYLFMISGLLLLDDSPFSNPAPGQYIRLAGFLSLSSFVVSYQPRLFSMLIVWAFHRIQVREGDDTNLDKAGTDTLRAKKTTITEVTATQPHTPSKDD
jgi:hypothetical protein